MAQPHIVILVALLDGPKKEDESGDSETQQEDHTDSTIIPLRSINAVATHVPFIEEAQTSITAEMESMVITGLNTSVGIFPMTVFRVHNALSRFY